MKKLVIKYSQQIIIALLFITASAGVIFAEGGGVFTSAITWGFLRAGWHYDTGPQEHGGHHFYYGYGYSGDSKQWGYGFGYSDKDGDKKTKSVSGIIGYGFEGDSGVPDVSVDPQKTTAKLNYSTPYLSKIGYAYSTEKAVKDNILGYYEESDFNSGVRSNTITGLICNTSYYYDAAAEDASGTKWFTSSYFTTLPCIDAAATTSTNSVGSHATGKPFGTPSSDAVTQGQFPESPKLYYGDFGPGPKKIQLLLNKLGFKLGTTGAGSPGHETSFFGPKTKAALKKFQAAHGLNPDGVYGPLVQAAMLAELNK